MVRTRSKRSKTKEIVPMAVSSSPKHPGEPIFLSLDDPTSVEDNPAKKKPPVKKKTKKKKTTSSTKSGRNYMQSNTNTNATSMSPLASLPSNHPDYITDIVLINVERDIICGRGVTSRVNKASCNYVKLVGTTALRLVSEGGDDDDDDKTSVAAQEIVKEVAANNGRFLTRNKLIRAGGTWVEMDEVAAIAKTNHQLRMAMKKMKGPDTTAASATAKGRKTEATALEKESALYLKLLATPQKQQVKDLTALHPWEVDKAVKVINVPCFLDLKAADKLSESKPKRAPKPKESPVPCLCLSSPEDFSPVTSNGKSSESQVGNSSRSSSSPARLLAPKDTSVAKELFGMPLEDNPAPSGGSHQRHPGMLNPSQKSREGEMVLVPDSKRKYPQKSPRRLAHLQKRQKLTQETSGTSTERAKGSQQPQLLPPPSILRVSSSKPREQAKADMGEPLSESMLASLFSWSDLSPTKRQARSPLSGKQATRSHPGASSAMLAASRTPPHAFPSDLVPPAILGFRGYSNEEFHRILYNRTAASSFTDGETRADTRRGAERRVQPDETHCSDSALNDPSNGKSPPALPHINTSVSQDMSAVFGLENTGWKW